MPYNVPIKMPLGKGEKLPGGVDPRASRKSVHFAVPPEHWHEVIERRNVGHKRPRYVISYDAEMLQDDDHDE